MRRSKKDKAEHLMIVDLLRNDIGKFSKFGSVEVDNLFNVKSSNEAFQLELQLSNDLTDKNTPISFEVIVTRINPFPKYKLMGLWKLYSMEIDGVNENISQLPTQMEFRNDNSYSIIEENTFMKVLKSIFKFIDKIILVDSHFHAHEIKSGNDIFFEYRESVEETLNNNNLEFIRLQADNSNAKIVIDEIKKMQTDYIIYTGGGILGREVLSLGKSFIHIHPGILPNYKGSTCFYYSLLKEGTVGCTAFIMNEQIDSGQILLSRLFQVPKNIDLDYIFDPWMRSEILVEILQNYIHNKKFLFSVQENSESQVYYIIHPVSFYLLLQLPVLILLCH